MSQEPDQQCVKFPLTTLRVRLKAVWEAPVSYVAAFPRSFCPMGVNSSMSSRQLKAMGDTLLLFLSFAVS